MKKTALILGIFLFLISFLYGSVRAEKPQHPANTYSIVAYDSTTGEFGAAVQSHWFKVANVIWAEPGVGVVATQSLVDFAYGPLGLEMMKNGKSAELAPDNLEILFWQAVTLITMGEEKRSLPIFERVFDQDDNRRALVPRLVPAGLLPDDDQMISRIVAQ